ncbi:MAG: right-handed parallel beta-helix repeat-containing protein, partial [Planctomycetota bacterium]|nr:right-handed parallel beta-helix repeat-containing protein [Planctomycetota bacterium]
MRHARCCAGFTMLEMLVVVLIVALLLVSAAAQAGPVLHVDDDAPPSGDGLSWNTAFRFLADALTTASGGGISEIRVGQGTYQPDRDETNPTGSCPPGPCDRAATFQLINGVAVRGGYAGVGAPDPDARDIALYETILSGDLIGNDGPNFINNDENSYHVTSGGGTDGTAVLDGCTVTAGNADGILQNGRGGGMYNVVGSPMVANCSFTGNFALRGAGILNMLSSPTVSNCTFSSNFAAFGGGMANLSGSNSTITDCTFSGNTAGLGGGIYNEGSSPTVTDCAFSGNTTDGGGGMANAGSSNPTVTNCSFNENSAAVRGGGMHNGGSSPTVANCTFSGNTAAIDGGGMHNFNSSPAVTNCTFSCNTAPVGGGMFNEGSSPTVSNCILWGNTAASFGGPGTPSVTYSDIEGGFAGTGNINADPMFVASGIGDYRLMPGSPCIDAADNTAVPKGITTDLDGNPRFVDDPDTPDTGNGDPPVVDMGAYEFQDTTVPADISGPLGVPDGCVDAFDLGTLLGAWCSSATDPDPPGDVDPPCEGCTSPNFNLADISGAAKVPDGCVDAF